MESTLIRTPTNYPHIELDHKGRPVITGTRFRVSMVVEYVYGTAEQYSPAQMIEAFPHLTLSQIHSALAYYHDHKAEIDATIEEGHKFVEEMRAKYDDPERTARLLERAREMGLLKP
jgi:uncharacterized protein (DUF433 family)